MVHFHPLKVVHFEPLRYAHFNPLKVVYYSRFLQPSTKNINTLLQLVRYAGEATEEFEQLVQYIKPLLFDDEVDKNKVRAKNIRLEGQMLQNLKSFFRIINLSQPVAE